MHYSFSFYSPFLEVDRFADILFYFFSSSRDTLLERRHCDFVCLFFSGVCADFASTSFCLFPEKTSTALLCIFSPVVLTAQRLWATKPVAHLQVKKLLVWAGCSKLRKEKQEFVQTYRRTEEKEYQLLFF